MAVSFIYKYKIDDTLDADDFISILDCLDVLYVLNHTGRISFAYNTRDKKIYPTHMPTNYVGDSTNLTPLTPDMFLQTWLKRGHIYVDSRSDIPKKGLFLIQTKEYYNYPRMIDDLEERGIIRVYPSKNYMANDPRKFSFKEKEDIYEVDCLGTKLCQTISEEVRKAWEKYQNT